MEETNDAIPSPKKKEPNNHQKLAPILGAVIEMGFIIFLFYSNLLMGEFTQSNSRQGKSLVIAIKDIFTVTNFVIAISAALIGYTVFEYLRKKL